MPNTTAKLTWCKARIGEDMNWWIKEISDPIHWEIDGLGIIDPRQFQHLLDLLEPLGEYGLQTDLVEEAFYAFGIDEILEDKSVLLKRVPDNILDREEMRESQNSDFLEGRATHYFTELTSILEYVPEGFELDEDEESTPKSEDEELQKDLAGVDAGTDTEETLVADETMKWDEEEEEEENYEEHTSPPDEAPEEEPEEEPEKK
jgi:hypothetical protein